MQNVNDNKILYLDTILPIKFAEPIYYTADTDESLKIGNRIEVTFANKKYIGVIRTISTSIEVSDNKTIKYKSIDKKSELTPVKAQQIELWEELSKYYMCTIGEIYKAAYPLSLIKQEAINSKLREQKASMQKLPQLSYSQAIALSQIESAFKTGNGTNKPVLLHGITGSGKTEIYMTLAEECLKNGKNVLYMVPEIAISKQLSARVKNIFGNRLLVYHSKQTIAQKSAIHKLVSQPSAENNCHIILGTRSALFLPFDSLGLIIVDEEHDSSYKQTEPAPRYNAKDAAIMLSGIYGADLLLGSATPTFESLYNCKTGRFVKVELNERYYGSQAPEVEVIDTIYAKKTHQMRGSFTQKLINEIKKCISTGGQVMVFRNRRAYAPIIECSECGYIPKCPHCNVYLSYHKYNNTLRCHYCEFKSKFSGKCPTCGSTTFNYKGAGTEKLEEELKEIIPDARIARYDADIAKSKKEEEKVLKEFAKGEIDIIIGTQMISKGFDFENLKIVVVLQADTITGIQDFRADEKALQLFNQLMGRTGRRSSRGKLIVQTSQKDHPIYKILIGEETHSLSNLMQERKDYNFTPFVRMIKIIIKHADIKKVDAICLQLQEKFKNGNFLEVTGPFSPVIDKIRGEWIKCFYIKFARDKRLTQNKAKLLSIINEMKEPNNIIIDVDPQ